MLKYQVNQDKLPTYGIDGVKNGVVVAKAEGLFYNKKDAEKFAELCNTVELSPIHLHNVAEDILNRKTKKQ